MAARRTQLIKVALRLLVTIVLLVWVFRQIDAGDFWQTAKAAKWQYLVAVWGLTVVLFWIRSMKMQIILRKQDCLASVGTIFSATVVTALYSMILPGMLSTGVKWYILKKNTGKGSNVLSSMVYHQLSTVVIMTTFGLGVLMVTNPSRLLPNTSLPSWVLPVVCGTLLVGTIIVSLLVLSSKTGHSIVHSFTSLLRPFPERIRNKGAELLRQIVLFQTVGTRFHLYVALITIIDTLIGGVITYVLAAKSANIDAPITIFIWLCAVIYVLGRLPISLANLGVRESLLVSLLALYGVEKSAALLMSMILFSALVFMALIGAGYQLVWLCQKTTGRSSENKIIGNPF